MPAVTVETLQEARTRFERWRPQDGPPFAGLLAEFSRLTDINQSEIAAAFGIARSTVSRWLHGAVSPHPHMQREVVDWMASMMAERLDQGQPAEPVLLRGEEFAQLALCLDRVIETVALAGTDTPEGGRRTAEVILTLRAELDGLASVRDLVARIHALSAALPTGARVVIGQLDVAQHRVKGL